ncbi:50S ribosomal protein L16 [Klebsiella pneumoniae]|nr:50S ribosomal protein L16 [Klebsiella pneumoniae]
MLQPKRTKFRKVHKGRNRGLAQGTDVSFGTFGLKSCWPWSSDCTSDRSSTSCYDPCS